MDRRFIFGFATLLVLLAAINIALTIGAARYFDKRLSRLETGVKSGLFAAELLAIKETVLNINPELANAESDLDLAIRLRHLTYYSVPNKNYSGNLKYYGPYHVFRTGVCNPDGNIGFLCGGKSEIYISMLEAFGIPSRQVLMFSKIIYPYDTHAGVEFMFDGRWIASDPTYNAMFKRNGTLIGYRELREVFTSGESYATETNDRRPHPGLPGYEDIAQSFPKWTNYMAFLPTRLREKDGTYVALEATFIPMEWTGDIRLEKETINVVPRENTRLEILSQGLLR